jgi:hypothetical protein
MKQQKQRKAEPTEGKTVRVVSGTLLLDGRWIPMFAVLSTFSLLALNHCQKQPKTGE